MTLLWQFFRSHLKALTVWVAIALGLSLATTSAAPAAVANGAMNAYIDKLPESLRSMVGYTSGLGPLDQYIVAKYAPLGALVLVLYATLLALSIVTREVDRRTIDFLLALPVSRTQVALARLATMAVNTGVLAAVMWLALRFHLESLGLTGSFEGYGLLLLVQWLLAMAIGCLVFLISLWIDDYGFAVKLFLGTASGAYLLEMLLRAGNISRAGRLLSPFSYADAGLIVREKAVPGADLAVLLIVIAASVAVAMPVFARKQISA